jgi:hypothetical protein
MLRAAGDQLLAAGHIRCFIRRAQSSGMRGDQRVPLKVLAVMANLNRQTLLRIGRGGTASDDVAAVLSLLMHQTEASKLRFRRLGPRSRDPTLRRPHRPFQPSAYDAGSLISCVAPHR